jgi:hypothetical protein
MVSYLRAEVTARLILFAPAARGQSYLHDLLILRLRYFCRGVGLWGVWETSSGTGAHFELQKGGVFRAAPMALLSAS